MLIEWFKCAEVKELVEYVSYSIKIVENKIKFSAYPAANFRG